MLSAPVEILDGSGAQGSVRAQGSNIDIYAYIPEAKAKGEFQVITHDGDEEYSPKVADPATLAVYQYVGVLLEAQTAAGYAWVRIKGKVKALVDGTTDVAKDDYLEVLNNTVGAVKDATTRSVNSVAIAREAQATNENTLTDVELLGDRAIIAAS